MLIVLEVAILLAVILLPLVPRRKELLYATSLSSYNINST